MSNAAAVGAPMPTATWVAIAGVWYRCVTVETMTQPIWPGSMPAWSSAFFAALTDIASTVSSASAQRRSLIPERVWIHSSDESMFSRISAFVTTRRGR